MGLSPTGSRSPWAFDDPTVVPLLLKRHRESISVKQGVHPTWLVRALREESPAVRATVAAHAPSSLARLLRAEGALPEPIGTPHPDVVAWVLTLWTERLVGGSPSDDDPPVIVALTRPAPIAGYHLWRTVGIVKSALARDEKAPSWIHERLGTPTPEIRAWAKRDVDAVAKAGIPGRRGVALLGLFTAMRLLHDVDPYTMRWAIQRLPYPIVRQMRALLPDASRRSRSISRLEGIILRAGWEHIFKRRSFGIPDPSRARRESVDGD